MSFASHPRVARAFRSSIIALLMCLALLTLPNQADAATTGCRGDPIIYLSNGAKIQLFVAVNADASSVTNVTYTVHIPANVTVTKIIMNVPTSSNLPGISTNKEKVNVYADLADKQYQISTLVLTTATTSATVTGTFTPSTTAASTNLTVNDSTGVAIPINYTAL